MKIKDTSPIETVFLTAAKVIGDRETFMQEVIDQRAVEIKLLQERADACDLALAQVTRDLDDLKRRVGDL